MKKSTRRAWSQEDIDWLKNEFHDWKKSYIQTNFSNATEEGIKKWIVRIPELFLKCTPKEPVTSGDMAASRFPPIASTPSEAK